MLSKLSKNERNVATQQFHGQPLGGAVTDQLAAALLTSFTRTAKEGFNKHFKDVNNNKCALINRKQTRDAVIKNKISNY